MCQFFSQRHAQDLKASHLRQPFQKFAGNLYCALEFLRFLNHFSTKTDCDTSHTNI